MVRQLCVSASLLVCYSPAAISQTQNSSINENKLFPCAQNVPAQRKPRKEFRALKDNKPFKEVADEIKRDLLKELSTLQFEDYQRVAFYPLASG